MSNWCNRNTLEYRLFQNDPEYAGLPEWFIVDPGSQSDINLRTPPPRYYFVPPGLDVVNEKDQAGKDQADAELQAIQEENARLEAEAQLNSTLEPTFMTTRAWQEVTTDDLNAQIANLTETLTVASQAAGFNNFQQAIENGLGAQVPLTDADRETRAQAKIAAGDVDGPAQGAP